MYTAFYGLKEEPFNITPDPRFLYWSPKHQEAFRHLVYGVQSNKGLVVLTGDPGTGKTALLHAVTEHLNKVYPGVHIAFVVNSKITVQDLFCLIFDDFHIENTVDSKSMYLIHLKNFLVNNHRKNEKNVLILDEAQNFHPTILEEIRLLSNMETSAEKLLHIFLVGQPQLIDNIKTPALGQLKQRLGIIYNLLPLNRQETELYIHKRLSVAGAPEADMFTSDALDEIFAHAKGLPRLINTICDNALLFGCAANAEHVNQDIIRRVVQDMDINIVDENVATDSGLPTRSPALPAESRTLASPVVPAPLPSTDRPGSQDAAWHDRQAKASDDADRFIILQNTVLSEESYWDNLLGKSANSEKNLAHTWKEAAEQEARQRVRRFFVISVTLLGLLGGIVGEHLGWWSLRTAVGRVVETVTQQVAWLSGTAVAPDAVGGRAQGHQETPLSRQALPTTPSGNERNNTGMAAAPSPQNLARKTEGNQSPAPSRAVSSAQGQPPGEEKVVAVKKVVIVRSGDSLSKILIQEYGEYTRSVVDLVVEANPGLRNIERLGIGQRLILPERPE